MSDIVLPIPGGPTNKEIIDHAYMSLGVSDSMFGRTDEEYAAALMLLRGMMGEWPFTALSFDDAVADVGEESGIERRWLSAVAYSLAERIGATIGKALVPQFARIKTRSFSELCAALGNQSRVQYARRTAAGAGSKDRIFYGPSDTEEEDGAVTEVVAFDIDALPPVP